MSFASKKEADAYDKNAR
ncbi:hypothetical protein CJ307_35645, partial [Klebsiella quasipneumoniae]